MDTGSRTGWNVRRFALAAMTAGALGLALVAWGQKPPAAAAKPLETAHLTPAGKMQKPEGLESWVFLGTSLGMGYNPGSFNADHPGQFQVVLMEPNAYRHFVQTGSYAPGSMFLLNFFNSDEQKRSINQNGYTQADLTNFEIHVIDPKGPEGHSFYLFGANDKEGNPTPPGSACVRCHVDHGAFNGTFAQFYPTLRPMIPQEALEKAAQDHNIR
jgi:cytochrome P460